MNESTAISGTTRKRLSIQEERYSLKDGKPVKMIGTIADVTEHHSIIKKLQESDKLHKQAQALTHIGNWSWVVNENKINWSDEMYRIYGLEPQSEEISFERFYLLSILLIKKTA